MRLTHFIILFVIFTLPYTMMQHYKVQKMEMNNFKKQEMNQIIDSASMDALEALIVKQEGMSSIISPDQALSAFYRSLYIALDIENDPVGQRIIQGYIPMIGIIAQDGFIGLTKETIINSNGDSEVQAVWLPKKLFVDEDGRYVVQYTLGTFMKIFDRNTNLFFEGDPEQLSAQIPDCSLLSDPLLLEQKRCRCIMETLEGEMSAIIASHNIFAKSLGIHYDFCFPTIEDDVLVNSIHDIGFVAFFQGLPTGVEGMVYNSYAFTSAQIIKESRYYIQQSNDSVVRYYHHDDCPYLVQKNESYSSREECALQGAYPCDYCKP